MRSQSLVPPPQIVEEGTSTSLVSGLRVASIDRELQPVDVGVERLRAACTASGESSSRHGTATALRLELRRSPGLGDAEYRLAVRSGIASLDAGSAAGAFYALQTLVQWIELHPRLEEDGPREIRSLSVHDWPDLSHRGVLIDVSRSRVPTMGTLRDLVDRLASWKINQLQLYTEHTFAYAGHERVWRGASPMTPAQVRELDGYCRARQIELVANQNSFGHLHRWLRHEPYRGLAECPEGLEHPFGEAVEPFSLSPVDPGSVALLEELYRQLLPCFSSRQVNVGLDETFDLGRGRSAAAARRDGVGQLYLGFLLEIHRLLAASGHRMQFWGDILAKHPELIEELPDDVTVLSWGYEQDHRFDTQIEPLAAAGRACYVCPGTSSWLSFAGRVENAVANIAAAVRAARRHGAAGCLVTDWGDRGHLQPQPVSYPGILTAAAMSWNSSLAEAPDDWDLPVPLARHGFGGQHGPDLADALLALGGLYAATGARSFNSSPLFHLTTDPSFPIDHARLRGLSRERLDRCREVIARVRATLTSLPEGLERRELDWVALALDIGARVGRLRLDTGGGDSPLEEASRPARTRLAEALEELADRHRDLWLARSREGGREESVAVLHRAARRLRSPVAD